MRILVCLGILSAFLWSVKAGLFAFLDAYGLLAVHRAVRWFDGAHGVRRLRVGLARSAQPALGGGVARAHDGRSAGRHDDYWYAISVCSSLDSDSHAIASLGYFPAETI
jgi:hypothetical protein